MAATSNDSELTASWTSPGPRPGLEQLDQRKLVSARWGTWTPLGRPVEPEV
jgi:hypothetical protein